MLLESFEIRSGSGGGGVTAEAMVFAAGHGSLIHGGCDTGQPRIVPPYGMAGGNDAAVGQPG